VAFVFVGLDACLPQSGAVVIESLNLTAHAVAPARHTLPSPATNPPKQIVLRDGALTVYRRSRSQRYAARHGGYGHLLAALGVAHGQGHEVFAGVGGWQDRWQVAHSPAPVGGGAKAAAPEAGRHTALGV